MHLHLSVDDLQQGVRFYQTLFGVAPTVLKSDYAKWLLDDPRVNFAISQRAGVVAGLDHVGIQVEQAEELAEIKSRLDDAALTTLTQTATTCCYAQSDKHWVVDPAGIAWETYHTLGDAPTFHGTQTSAEHNSTDSACCAPAVQMVSIQGLRRSAHDAS